MSELTYREMQIAEMVAAGLTAKQIGHRLGISPQTVKNSKVIIYQKLGVKNAPQMVRVLGETV
jgi:DNA-binding CsgD family transcriptional regulator